MGVLYGDQRYLFILGHMRGYTTLLSHILGSHAQIRGYAEQHLAYDSLGALKTLRRRLAAEAFPARHSNGGFLLDKLLHNRLALADFVTASANVRLVVTLREPLATLRSLVAHVRGFSEDKALRYYTRRLAGLRALAERLPAPQRALYLDADDLLRETPRTLAGLAAWLGLAEPLRERYDLFEHSGERRFGDTSPRLFAGHVVREPSRHPIALDAATIRRARAAHEACRASLVATLTRCRTGAG